MKSGVFHFVFGRIGNRHRFFYGVFGGRRDDQQSWPRPGRGRLQLRLPAKRHKMDPLPVNVARAIRGIYLAGVINSGVLAQIIGHHNARSSLYNRRSFWLVASVHPMI